MYTIGQVAERTGVPVKTIRYYSDLGVLPPTRRSSGGYRLYSEADCLRLELVRSLRALDFDLSTIGALLDERMAADEVVEMHLEAVEVQIRALQRQRTVLRLALARTSRGEPSGRYGDRREDGRAQPRSARREDGRPQPGGARRRSASNESDPEVRGGPPDNEGLLAHLRRLQALATLDRIERQTFLSERIEAGLADVPIDPEWHASFWGAALRDMPEELDSERLAAWVELVELIDDDEFFARVRAQTRPFWEAAAESPGFEATSFQGEVEATILEAARAFRQGAPHDGERARKIVFGWMGAHARAMGREADAEFARWFLAHLDSTRDDRIERFWRLLAIINGWPRRSARAAAFEWLLEGLRRAVAAQPS